MLKQERRPANDPSVPQETRSQLLKFEVAPIVHDAHKDTSSLLNAIHNEHFRELLDLPENDNIREFY